MVRKQIKGRGHTSKRGLAAALDILSDKFRTAIHEVNIRYDSLGINHALIGGIAVSSYVEPKSTDDIDFLVGDEAFHKKGLIISFKENVPLEAAGVGIDSVPIDERYRKLYETALSTAIISDEGGIKVVRPDYLAALKLVPGRRKDYAAFWDLIESEITTLKEVHALIKAYPKLKENFDIAIGPSTRGNKELSEIIKRWKR